MQHILPLITYPLDVIKTNRILDTTLAKESKGCICTEFKMLMTKCNLQNGPFRGALAYCAIEFLQKAQEVDIFASRSLNFLSVASFSLLMNPLYITVVMKQAAPDFQTISY